MHSIGLLVIITGTTASGKDEVMKRLLKHYPTFKRIVTTTTRPPREHEINGQDYFFVTSEEFKNLLAQNEFFEYVEYAGNYYGTLNSQLLQVIDNQNLIWRIEPTMAAKARSHFAKVFDFDTAKKLSDRTIVFLITANQGDIKQRLQTHGVSNADIQKRIVQDINNLKILKGIHDYEIKNENGKIDQAIQEVIKYINLRLNRV